MSAKILVLEDDHELRNVIVEFLTMQKFETHGAQSGSEAIAVASRKPLDLLLTDVRMEGMDGLECLAAIRQAHPGLRSIVMTGYASQDAPSRALKLEADDYLYKPFQVKQLLTAVRRVLERNREREGYLGMLPPFVRGFFSRSAAVERSWEQLRDLALQSFYVGVRSRKLNRDEALSVWDDLEKLVKAQPSAGEEELARGYQVLIDRIAALSRSDISMPRRGPEGVRPERFFHFFQRVQSGELSSEQVRVAPLLWSLPPATLEASPKLQELVSRIWGAS